MMRGARSELTSDIVEASKRFAVAGVGVPARGQSATAELLKNVGASPPLALVVLHHRGAAKTDELVDVLSRATTMPLRVPKQSVRVEQGHVYVAPPDRDLWIDQGVLHVVPRVENDGVAPPIDQFLQSLAVNRRSFAIGVALGGSGYDGARGIKAIKASGGVTFAEDAGAKRTTKPSHAIGTGCVDFVLSPAEIGRELALLGAYLRNDAPLPFLLDHDKDLGRVLAAVRKIGGAAIENFKESTLRGQIERRIRLQRLSGLHEYADHVESSVDEARALCDDVLIQVTSFFDDPGYYRALETFIFPKLLANRDHGEPLRLWVPGCSTGEDVYSIAISLRAFLTDAGASKTPFKIFGTDVSPTAIAKARTGRCAEDIKHYGPAARFRRFFSLEDGAHVVRREIRDACVFGNHDPSSEPPFSRMDFISCRNRLLHLNYRAQHRSVDTFRRALNMGGFLVLDRSEKMGPLPGFECVDARNAIFQRSPMAKEVHSPLFASRPAPSRAGHASDEATSRFLGSAAENGSVSRPMRSLAHAGDDLVPTRDALQALVAQLEISNEKLRDAHEEVLLGNEVLHSTNEELETAKHELQATNEQLRSVSDEMTERAVATSRLYDDLCNILTSADIPIVLLGPDLTIRRFTPAATKVLRLREGDVGRPLTDIEPRIRVEDLSQIVNQVLTRLTPIERTVQDDEGCFYQLTVRPYLTLDRRIDGTVITFINIDRVKRTEQRLADAQGYAENIVDTVRESLVVIDTGLHVRSANRAFYETFAVTEEETIGHHLFDLGQQRLNVPALRDLLENLTASGDERCEGVRLEHDFDGVGRLVFVLNARRIHGTPLTLLALKNVTEQDQAERALEESKREYQNKLKSMAFDAALSEDRERRRIAADLHDSIGQALALAQIKLASVRVEMAGRPRAAVDEAVELIAQSAADARTLTFELSPPILYDLGLKEALSWLVEDVEKRYGICLELKDDDEEKPLDDGTAAMVFRAVRELVTNVFKHAQCKRCTASLRRTGGELQIEVADRGIGFNPNEATIRSTGRFGLFSVREQISRLGGRFDVASAPGTGTRVGLRVPLRASSSANTDVRQKAP